MSFGAAVDLYYKKTRSGCPVHGTTLANDNDVKTPDFGLNENQLKKVLKQIENNPKQMINPELFTYTYRMLNKGLSQAFDKINITDPNFIKVQKMRKSLAVFSAYKTAHQTADLKKALQHEKTAEVAQMVNTRYNNDWLRTEYVHTVRSARHANNFWQYQNDKDLYPYLEYTPSRSAEPRNEHKKLYGIVKPVDDAFWDTWLPPNDWGCKCGVKQVREPGAPKEVPEIKKPPAVMRHNPAKTGEIFSNKHPMVKRVTGNAKKQIYKELQILKKKTPAILAYTGKNKAKLYINVFASDAQDFNVNLTHAKILTDNGFNIILLHYTDIQGLKNPELLFIDQKLIGDFVVERKTKNVEKYIKNAFSDKYRKGKQLNKFNKSVIVIKIDKNEIINAARKINGEFKSHSQSHKVIVIIDNKVAEVSKTMKYEDILSEMTKASK